MRTLYLLFYSLIFLQICKSFPLKIEDGERILGMASNEHTLAVALPSKMLFYSMIPSRNQTSLEKLFTIEFDENLPAEDLEFELYPDNRFVLCSVKTCRFVDYMKI